jgi:hypothetical protein
MRRTNAWSSVRGNNAGRWRLNTALNVLLVVLFVVAFVTGWIACLLGVSSFEPHRDSSIALTLAVVAHLVLHRRTLALQLRRCLARTARPLLSDADSGRALSR